MKYFITLLVPILLLFSTIGCSTTSSELTPLTPIRQSIDYNDDSTLSEDIQEEQKNTAEDEFEDEFEDEAVETLVDPLNGYNRVMTSFNDGLFLYILSPLSEAYATVLPQTVRTGVSRFMHNLKFPIRFSNNLLQGKLTNASDEIGRFLVNSTVGIVGIFDPASEYMHIESHNEDFGQTLGFYGVGAGFHIVLPFLGPSNVRDLIGLTVDGYTSPLIYQSSLDKYRLPQNTLESWGIYSLEIINKTSLNLGAYEGVKKDAIDLYPFLRDIYEQKRTSDIEE